MSEDSYCTPERLAACKAFCCHIPFHLTDAEVNEGVARWHPDFPHHILQVGPEERCFHLDPETLRCTIYAKRPAECRAFDCRKGRGRPGSL